MELTLELLTGSHAGAARVVDGNRDFSVGTKPGSTWMLPMTGDALAQARVSKDRKGFVVEAEGDVQLEGQPIGDGGIHQLGHGNHIHIAGMALRLMIGQASSGFPSGTTTSQVVPTISSILSDVAPGGNTAQGPLPGRTGEEWLEELTNVTEQQPQVSWKHAEAYGEAETPSPLGPAPTGGAAPALSTYLPDDWDAPGDKQNQVTQSPSPTDTTRVPNSKPSPPRERPDARLTSGVKAFLKAAEILPEEMDGPVEEHMAMFGRALRVLLEGVAEIETEQSKLLMELDASQMNESKKVSSDLLLAGGDPKLVVPSIRARIDRLVTTERAIADVTLSNLAAAQELLDPEIVSTSTTQKSGLRARLSPDAAAWNEYRRRWEEGGALLSFTSFSHKIQDRLNDILNAEQIE